jgi:predicted secreted protein
MTWGGTSVGGMTTKTLKLNGKAIDITNDDSAGIRNFIGGSKYDVKSVDITLTGFVVDQRLITDWQNGTFEKTLAITFEDARVLSGTFELQSIVRKHDHKAAIQIDAEFVSSGTWTWA